MRNNLTYTDDEIIELVKLDTFNGFTATKCGYCGKTANEEPLNIGDLL